MTEINNASIEQGEPLQLDPQRVEKLGQLHAEREQWLNERYGEVGNKFDQIPTTVNVEGVGEVQGWTNPTPDATTWELLNGVDVLGPDFESYDGFGERICCRRGPRFGHGHRPCAARSERAGRDFG